MYCKQQLWRGSSDPVGKSDADDDVVHPHSNRGQRSIGSTTHSSRFLLYIDCLYDQVTPCLSMLSRVNQLARHLTRPLPNYAHRSAAAFPASPRVSSTMGDSKRLIQTAACLIIGDEVLGGKVRC